MRAGGDIEEKFQVPMDFFQVLFITVKSLTSRRERRALCCCFTVICLYLRLSVAHIRLQQVNNVMRTTAWGSQRVAIFFSRSTLTGNYRRTVTVRWHNESKLINPRPTRLVLSFLILLFIVHWIWGLGQGHSQHLWGCYLKIEEVLWDSTQESH